MIKRKKLISKSTFIFVGVLVGLIIYFFPFIYYFGGNLFKEMTLQEEGEQQIYYKFEYECESYDIPLTLFESYNDYFSTIQKGIFYLYDMPESKFEEKYYNTFLDSDKDEKILQEVISAIKTEIGKNESDEVAVALISLVQNIEYDCDKYFSYLFTEGYNAYETNYPYETLFDKKGVCEDSSILLAKLLRYLGYGSVLFSYYDEAHMAVGISCPMEYSDYYSGYCFIETTTPSMIGVIPKLEGDIELLSAPLIIKVSEGKQFEKIKHIKEEQEKLVEEYDESILDFAACADIEHYKRLNKFEKELKTYEETLDKYEKQLYDMGGSLSASHLSLSSVDLEYSRLISGYNRVCTGPLLSGQYNYCMREYNKLRNERIRFNKKSEEYNELIYTYDKLYDKYVKEHKKYVKKADDYNERVYFFNEVLDEKGCYRVADKSLSIIGTEPTDLGLYNFSNQTSMMNSWG